MLNSKYDIAPIYVCLLIFRNEYSDIKDSRYPELIKEANRLVVCMDVRTDDCYRAIVFSEPELTTCVTALKYAKSRGFTFAPAYEYEELVRRLSGKKQALFNA